MIFLNNEQLLIIQLCKSFNELIKNTLLWNYLYKCTNNSYHVSIFNLTLYETYKRQRKCLHLKNRYIQKSEKKYVGMYNTNCTQIYIYKDDIYTGLYYGGKKINDINYNNILYKNDNNFELYNIPSQTNIHVFPKNHDDGLIYDDYNIILNNHHSGMYLYNIETSQKIFITRNCYKIYPFNEYILGSFEWNVYQIDIRTKNKNKSFERVQYFPLKRSYNNTEFVFYDVIDKLCVYSFKNNKSFIIPNTNKCDFVYNGSNCFLSSRDKFKLLNVNTGFGSDCGKIIYEKDKDRSVYGAIDFDGMIYANSSEIGSEIIVEYV